MQYDEKKIQRQLELEEEGIALGIKRYRIKSKYSFIGTSSWYCSH